MPTPGQKAFALFAVAVLTLIGLFLVPEAFPGPVTMWLPIVALDVIVLGFGGLFFGIFLQVGRGPERFPWWISPATAIILAALGSFLTSPDRPTGFPQLSFTAQALLQFAASAVAGFCFFELGALAVRFVFAGRTPEA